MNHVASTVTIFEFLEYSTSSGVTRKGAIVPVVAEADIALVKAKGRRRTEKFKVFWMNIRVRIVAVVVDRVQGARCLDLAVSDATALRSEQ